MSELHRFRSMGCEIVVRPERARTTLDELRDLFAGRDSRFTRFAPDSELLRVNAAAGRFLHVSEEFARALEVALWAADATDGLVDPTLLDALEAAGYDTDFEAVAAEGPAARAGATGRAGEIRMSGRLLERPPGLRLDLNGVVKSMAVDDAVARLGSGWVSAGGDLATTRPLDVALPGGGAVRLERGGLATSGSAVRRWRRGGRVQHHLVDPRTGRPADSPWSLVTACGASCVHADVAAKAAFLLAEDGPAWLDERGMPGRFLRADGSTVENDSWRGAVPTCT